MIYKVRRQIKVNNHTVNEIYKTAGFIRVYKKDNDKDKKDRKGKYDTAVQSTEIPQEISQEQSVDGNKPIFLRVLSEQWIAVDLNIEDLELRLSRGVYKPITECLEDKTLLFNARRDNIDFPHSEVELEQGYNW